MSDDLPTNLRPIVDFFGLVGPAPVVKDFHVVRAIRVIAALDATPFTLVFGGGTALARAHKLVRRMSEDIDFKIVPRAAVPVSRSALRRALKALRSQVTEALHQAGFAFDPTDENFTKSRDEDRYTVWHLPYDRPGEDSDGLRPMIQIELTYAPLRQPPVPLSVSSFVTEAMGGPPDMTNVPCVGLNETAAEKLVGLTRRTAMDLAGLTRGQADPTLVRHVYDLHMMREHVDHATVATLAASIATTDAAEFRHQYPAYPTDIAGETRKALDALQLDPTHRRRYADFVRAMVYGERPEFGAALSTVVEMATAMIQKGSSLC